MEEPEVRHTYTKVLHQPVEGFIVPSIWTAWTDLERGERFSLEVPKHSFYHPAFKIVACVKADNGLTFVKRLIRCPLVACDEEARASYDG